MLVGGFVMINMQREARPNVNFNRVNVSVSYPGAAPGDIEELVIDPIEDKISEVDGIKDFRSVSYTGAGAISVEIDDTYPNPEDIVDELRRKISEVRNLPTDANDPVITEAKASSIPVLSLALYGEADSFTFKLETEKLKDFLKNQPGIQSISSSGISDLQLKILADTSKLEEQDVTLDELMTQLSNWTKQRPGGLFENEKEVGNLTIGKDFNDLADLENFVIRSNYSGKSVKLSDVAKIEFNLEKLQSAKLYEDKESVLLTVIKKPFYDSVTAVDNLKVAIDKYMVNLPKGLSIKQYNDQSLRIRNKLKIVTSNAISGLVLVLIILLIFLDWRSAVVTSIGIPIAILGGIFLLAWMGNTMNSLVVVGIIIVLGMLVDDAIVVCENIYSYIEKGHSAKEAAYLGTKEVAKPVVASVLTTVFAFLPIVLMEGIMGQFLKVIPITVITMLVVSLIEALCILPVHAEEIMKPKKEKKDGFFKKIEDKYKKYISWTIKWRGLMVLLLIALFTISGLQGKKIFQKFSLFPSEGLDGLSVRIELSKNTPIAKTKEKVKLLSTQLLKVSDGTFDTLTSDIGQVTTGGRSGSRQNGSNLAMVNVHFVSDANFIYKERKILKDIRSVVQNFQETHNVKTSITLDRPGPPIGKPIQFQITSRDFKLGESIVQDIKSKLEEIKGVNSVESDLDGDTVSYRAKIDNNKAIIAGVDPSKISKTIFSATTGLVATEILKNNEKVEILLSLHDSSKVSIEKVLDLKVRNQKGIAVALRSFVNLEKETSPSSIQRLNGLRTITLFGEVDDKVVTGKEVNVEIAPYINKLRSENQSISIEVGGGEKDRMNALKDTMRLYILAIILIFMVISLSFDSVLYPFLVLTTIPMGLSGVIWSLVVHGKSLTLMGIIGIVGLSGVVVNVSILFLKFIQDEIDEGIEFYEAIVEAGSSRLRPIVMTTLSTLIGLLPTIYGVGGVDTFVQPIALVLGWGLFVATSLSLLFLPSLVSCFRYFLAKKTS